MLGQILGWLWGPAWPLGFSEQQSHADTISTWKGHLPPFAGKHADIYKCGCMVKWLTLKRH